MGGKNARKKLSKNTRIGFLKIVGKKSSGKNVKIRFYRHMNIVIKNWGKKREKNFSNVKKKSCQKSAKKKFFKKDKNIVTKNGGKKSEKKFLPESYVYREHKTQDRKSVV